MMSGRLCTRILQRPAALTVCLSLALLASCSTMGSKQTAVVTVKNDAAAFSKLGDGFLASRQYSSALQYYGEALDANLSVDNIEGAIQARSSLGRVYKAMGNLDDAEREFGDALEDARAFGNPSIVALALSNLGELYYARSDAKAADALFAEAETMAPEDEAIQSVIAHNRGVVAMARGDIEAARAYFTKAATANEKAGRFVDLGSNRYALASLANKQGDIPGAIGWAVKALEADKAAENSAGIAADLEALARLRMKNNEPALAFDLYRRALNVYIQLNQADAAERILKTLIDLSRTLGKESYAERYGALLERLKGL